MNHALARGFLPNWLARHFESYISIRHSYFSFSLLRMSCAMRVFTQTCHLVRLIVDSFSKSIDNQ
jgi:hypothetical protein